MSTPARDLARGNWKNILPSLGVDASFLKAKHGPCPNCGGKDRFRFDDKDGTGSFYCNQCGAGDGFTLLMTVNCWGFVEAARQVEMLTRNTKALPERERTAAQRKDPLRISACRKLWALTGAIVEGDPAGKYLASRGIADGMNAKQALRFHPALNYSEDGQVQQHPAIVAKISDLQGNGVNLQRIYLTANGRKAAVQSPKKLMKGEIPAGSAVRLASEAETMGIAEGVETALAASILYGVPVWAAIHAAGLQNWIPPLSARNIIIFADHDVNQAGQRAAQALEERLLQQGLQASICMPEAIGQDWNDVLLKRIGA